MLRQILDNLLAYSFSQEDAMKAIQKPEKKLAFFNKNLNPTRFQSNNSKMIVSFAMSLRNPKMLRK
jgi:hypothetical protein